MAVGKGLWPSRWSSTVCLRVQMLKGWRGLKTTGTSFPSTFPIYAFIPKWYHLPLSASQCDQTYLKVLHWQNKKMTCLPFFSFLIFKDETLRLLRIQRGRKSTEANQENNICSKQTNKSTVLFWTSTQAACRPPKSIVKGKANCLKLIRGDTPQRKVWIVSSWAAQNPRKPVRSLNKTQVTGHAILKIADTRLFGWSINAVYEVRHWTKQPWSWSAVPQLTCAWKAHLRSTAKHLQYIT